MDPAKLAVASQPKMSDKITEKKVKDGRKVFETSLVKAKSQASDYLKKLDERKKAFDKANADALTAYEKQHEAARQAANTFFTVIETAAKAATGDPRKELQTYLDAFTKFKRASVD